MHECLPTDVQVDYNYRLTVGIPPSLWPRLLQEVMAMGPTLAVYKWAILAKCGAAEVLIQHNVHGCTCYLPWGGAWLSPYGIITPLAYIITHSTHTHVSHRFLYYLLPLLLKAWE